MYLLPLLTTVLFSTALAHTWNEQLSVIESGNFVGSNGYPRGYVSRTIPGFYDDMMTYQLPPPKDTSRTRVNDSDFLCAPTQRTSNQTQSFPRLSAWPGAHVAMKYLENGHVTLPQNTPGKPLGGGTIFVFGTSQPIENELLVDVLEWTTDGTGGDRRGKLIAAQNFDDGRCYQINAGNISLTRQQEFPDPVEGQPGSVHEQWCETDVAIPSDVSINSTYTVYWVWQWPTAPGTLGALEGKDEYYTTCSDIDILAGLIQSTTPNPLPQQDPQKSAVPHYQNRSAYRSNPL
ncbi:hypothetical protein BT63DRAFT_466451 [Microthyrium microscopicum]|uniref:DUF7492 domain-containing protein n=1 Tax=Microthyrium microscopicum TaxID=703497 RepID=A0A6A6UNB6_9PEZI|nr:hypothetical protein BT63DRAFT_466451 [Microthyrium microscopicum]